MDNDAAFFFPTSLSSSSSASSSSATVEATLEDRNAGSSTASSKAAKGRGVRRRSSFGLVRGLELELPNFKPGIWVDSVNSPMIIQQPPSFNYATVNNANNNVNSYSAPVSLQHSPVSTPMMIASPTLPAVASQQQNHSNMTNTIAMMQQQQRMIIQQQNMGKQNGRGASASPRPSHIPLIGGHYLNNPTPNLPHPVAAPTLHSSPALSSSPHPLQIRPQFHHYSQHQPFSPQQLTASTANTFAFPSPVTSSSSGGFSSQISQASFGNNSAVISGNSLARYNSNPLHANGIFMPPQSIPHQTPNLASTPNGTAMISMSDVVPLQLGLPQKIRAAAIGKKRKQPTPLILSPTPELERVEEHDYESSSEDGGISSGVTTPGETPKLSQFKRQPNSSSSSATALVSSTQTPPLKRRASIPTKLSTVSSPIITTTVSTVQKPNKKSPQSLTNSVFIYSALPEVTRLRILSFLPVQQLAKFRSLDPLSNSSSLWAPHLSQLYPRLYHTLVVLKKTELSQLIDVLRAHHPSQFAEDRVQFWVRIVAEYVEGNSIRFEPESKRGGGGVKEKRTPSPSRPLQRKPVLKTCPEYIAYAICETGKKIMNGLRCGSCRCRPRVRDSVWCIGCGSFACGPKNFSKKCIYRGSQDSELSSDKNDKKNSSSNVNGFSCIHWSEECCYGCNTKTAAKCPSCNQFYCSACNDNCSTCS
ncbi:hypothetical protein BDR26DRAFT_12258 [Obelidium mucronatum]|nr:hypothetical protein BDR26DRAFT_12258 [Obelidium mucronatum]